MESYLKENGHCENFEEIESGRAEFGHFPAFNKAQGSFYDEEGNQYLIFGAGTLNYGQQPRYLRKKLLITSIVTVSPMAWICIPGQKASFGNIQ